ncbi:potassium transporter TrkG [Citricoccus sp. NPDC079358]|uniref:TrkH family potassium uptake protein n=1 Tax=Citricoccus sp. NPDC079358 TaxID=3154653 RepID=UPI00344D7918
MIRHHRIPRPRSLPRSLSRLPARRSTGGRIPTPSGGRVVRPPSALRRALSSRVGPPAGGPDRSGLREVLERLRLFVSTVAGASPARAALLAFAVVILVFTALLSLPFASRTGRVTAFHDALFVATSAVSVTGLTPVNTAEHWSFAGQLVILVALQIGGLGILSMAALLTLAVSKRLGVRSKLITQEGMTTGRIGEVGSLLRVVVGTTFFFEAVLAVVLVPRFMVHTGSWSDGLWNGIFYSVSAFNNAGFTLHTDGLESFMHDPWIIWTLMAGVFAGALGFPVVMVLMQQRWRWSRWNLHTKLTVTTTTALVLGGALLIGIFEWSNQATLGQFGVAERIQYSLFGSVMSRSGGFSVYDINEQSPETLLLTDALMFVGGGSASTAGGIKVTTLAVMFLAIVAEARGDREVTAHGRTITPGSVRVAISVLALGATLILVGTMALVAISDESLQRPLFEVLSAFGTCGLTTGLTAELPPAGKYVLTVLMFAGRVGTITFASALALRQRRILFRYPEERPIIG